MGKQKLADYKMVSIDEIKEHPMNPRVHSDSAVNKLVRSIEEFGFTNPVLVSKDGYILAGHGRLKASKKAGLSEVPAIFLDLEGDKADAYLIADNRLQEETDWDLPVLKDLIEHLDTGSIDLELTGFNEKELEDLMTQFHMDDEIKEDHFDVEENLPEEPITKRGDIWQLGEHRLMCGDSTSLHDTGKLMDGKKADMVFTDPPYGYEYQSNMRGKSEKFDVLKNDDKILDFMPAIKEFCNGFVFVCTTWKVLDKWIPLFKSYFELSNFIVWDKGGGGIGDLKKTFSTDHEIILVSHNGKELTGKRIGSVWDIKKDNASSYVHATQKPIELPAHAITHTTRTNDLVLDLFGGSGSTLIACEQTNRKARLMELDEKYCDVIVKRWEEYTGLKAELINVNNHPNTNVNENVNS